MKSILRFLDDCVSLVYPRLCLACLQEQPNKKEEIICTSCDYQLPETKMHLNKENRFTERFWGRIPLHTGASLFQFSKGSKVQQLLHNFKYKGQREIGTQLGQRYGYQLNQLPHFKDIDFIIPVPLHPAKKSKRGYNQSEVFANALAKEMDIQCMANGLARRTNDKSLTKQSRIERLHQIANAFHLNEARVLEHKHILLVDDVMTTGATLEACASLFPASKNIRISMATMAFTEQ